MSMVVNPVTNRTRKKVGKKVGKKVSKKVTARPAPVARKKRARKKQTKKTKFVRGVPDTRKKAFVFTVPGTGTRFTKRFLIDVLDYEGIADVSRFRGAEVGAMRQAHTGSTEFDEFYDMLISGEARVISALRDPYLAGISRPHSNRSMNPRMRIPGPMPDSAKLGPIAQWNGMIAGYDKLVADGVPIAFMNVDETDPVKRRTILENIATLLEADYDQEKFDAYLDAWEPVGRSHMTPYKEEYLASGTVGGEVLDYLVFAETWIAARA